MVAVLCSAIVAVLCREHVREASLLQADTTVRQMLPSLTLTLTSSLP